MINSKMFNDSIVEMLKSREQDIIEAREIINKEISSNKKITRKMLKKFNDSIGIDINIGSFTKTIFIREEFDQLFCNKELIACEDLIYNKNLANGNFSVNFYYDQTKDKVNQISINSQCVNTSFNVDIFLEKDFFINKIIVLNFEDEEPTILNHNQNNKITAFLNSLTEKNLTQLDTEDYQDLIQLTTDYKLDLTKYPAYEIFKLGFQSFLSDLNLETKNKNTMRPKI